MNLENQSAVSGFPIKYQSLILLLGTTIPLILLSVLGTDRAFFPDSVDYLRLGEKLITENDYSRSPTFLPFFRAPLYPFFIAAVWLVFPKSIFALLAAQCLIFGITALLLAKLAFFVVKNTPIAILTGCAYSFNPFALQLTTDVQTECLHTFLLAAGVFLLLKSNKTKNAFLFFSTGLIFGLAALCRPSALFVGLFLFGVIFLFNVGKVNWRGLLMTLLPVAGLFIAVMPWTIANYYKTNEFILINDAGGNALWLGNHPELLRMYDGSIKTREEYGKFATRMTSDVINEQIDKFEQSASGYYKLSLKQREKLWQNEAVNFMTESPLRALRLFGHKLWDYWRPYLLPKAYSTAVVAISLVYFCTFYLLAILGGIKLFRKENGKYHLTIFLSIFLASTIVHVIVISMIRFRLPYVEPYLTILAMIGLWHLFTRILKRFNLGGFYSFNDA